VKVIDDRAIMACQVTKVGTFPSIEALLGTWVALELFDTDAYVLDDYVDWVPELSENYARGYCEADDVPDG